MGRPLNHKYFSSGTTGEKVASVAVTNGGSYTSLSFPTLTFSAPALTGGTTATGVVSTVSANGGTIVAAGSGYAKGDTLTLEGGTGTAAIFEVTGISGGEVTGPVTEITLTSGGNYSAVTSGLLTSGVATLTNNGTGAGAGATIKFTNYGVSSITVTKGGSGYISVADAAISFSSGSAAATPVMAEAGSYNVLVPYANTLTTALPADIVKQMTSHSYMMKTSEGTAQCTLVATTSLVKGQAYLLATDSQGSTYFVTKITAHKVTITRNTGSTYDWPTGADVPWTFNSPNGTNVQITHA